MNTLDRSLVEKTGYENGFENVLENDESGVRLAFSRHPIIVEIIAGKSEGTWKLQFSNNLDIPELKRNLNEPLFPPNEISPWDRQTLAVILSRAAELGIALPDTPVKKYEQKIADFLKENPSAKDTEREQLVRQRIGQDLYREALMQYWKGSCAVTALDIPEALKASHAKPWKDCDTNSDRLNVYNGFLLSANLDSLFDSGLISFTDQGDLIYSSNISSSQILSIGLSQYSRLHWIDKRHLPYLAWHREKVFVK
jgi:predicted restriction endonuclease